MVSISEISPTTAKCILIYRIAVPIGGARWTRQAAVGDRKAHTPPYSRAASRHQTRFSQGVGRGVVQLEAKMK